MYVVTALVVQSWQGIVIVMKSNINQHYGRTKSEYIDLMTAIECDSCHGQASNECPFCKTKFCHSCWKLHKEIHKELL